MSDQLWNFASFAVPFFVDALNGTLILLALVWFAWLSGIGKASGIKQEYIEALESAHFWMNYGLLIIIGLGFGLRMLKRLLGGQ